MSDFIDIQGQLVRESAITRLSASTAAGVLVSRYHVHLADGGILTVSEVEYRKLKKRFDPPKPGRKSA